MDSVRIAGHLDCGQEAYNGDWIYWIDEVRLRLRLSLLYQLYNIDLYSVFVRLGAMCEVICPIVHGKSTGLLHRLKNW